MVIASTGVKEFSRLMWRLSDNLSIKQREVITVTLKTALTGFLGSIYRLRIVRGMVRRSGFLYFFFLFFFAAGEVSGHHGCTVHCYICPRRKH